MAPGFAHIAVTVTTSFGGGQYGYLPDQIDEVAVYDSVLTDMN